MGNSKSKKAGTPKTAKKPKKPRTVMQVLVAGTAQSGKSTFFKQLQLIHFDTFTTEQRTEVLKTLKSNCILGFKELIEHYDGLKKKPKISKSLNDQLEYFRKKNPFDVFDGDTKESADKLWKDSGFKKLWADRDTISLFSIQHLDYLMEHLNRLLADDAVPTTEDVLLARKRTTGTNEITFTYKNKDFRFVDVGGQKSERRHWDQIIDKPTAVLPSFFYSPDQQVVFFISLIDWNLPTVGNPDITKLDESLAIWSEIVEWEVFAETFFIVMLNKLDLFKEKIARVSLKFNDQDTFPDYTGDPKDWESAAEYIGNKFVVRLPEDRRDAFQSHVTCALDTEQMRTVFSAMQAAVLERLMSSFGMV